MAEKRNHWGFIPTQYFAEGLPYIIINNLSVAMFKSLGASNALIGMTSFLYIPWSIKFLWGPYVDANRTKRWWVIAMQMSMALLFGLSAFGVQLSSAFIFSLILFSVIAFFSATHDIATDGFYLHALDKKDQAFFSGIRSTFYRISMVVGGGLMVTLAGHIGTSTGNITLGWTTIFIILSFIFLILFFYHKWILPYPVSDIPVKEINGDISTIPFAKVFKEYFTQKKIGIILSYILLYRLGEGMLLKMAQPFFLDPVDKGGLNISLENVGVMYGTLGVIALLAGGILGGWLIKKFGLKKLIWPMALSMNIPILLFAYLAYFKPGIALIQTCIILEQFGYGVGFTAYMVYLLYISKGQFKTSLYAISTGLMAIGMMIPGFISGLLQEQVGYFWLFTISFIATIPGMLTIFFLPFEEEK